MKRALFILFASFVVVSVLIPAIAGAQIDTTSYVITTTDGNTYKGQVLNETDSLIYFKAYNIGEIRIRKNRIVSRLPLFNKNDRAKYWYKSPHNTRYFFLPNGYNLKSKSGYYQNNWVALNQVSISIGDYFTTGFGMVPLFLLGGPTPVWITPKVSIPIVENKINMGLGVLAATIIGEDFGEFVGLIYGLATFGPPDKNITIGGGYSFFGNELGDQPIISLGGMARINERNYFLSENYFIVDRYKENVWSADYSKILSQENRTDLRTALSLGMRNVKPKIAIDYGLIIPLNFNSNTFIAVPWLGITVPFDIKGSSAIGVTSRRADLFFSSLRSN